ncbi:MAG: carboxypeptidase-like regulatory domain-containing protein, partial [Terracidiphilus sp.]
MKAKGVQRQTHLVLRIAVLLVLGLVWLSTATYGQENATIVGTVTDPSGAVVPNAAETITNLDNGFVRTTSSNATGNYSAPQLPAGHYKMQVDAKGFKTFEQKDIVLEVGETRRIDAALQVGAVGQSVTVEATALQIQADTSDVSQTITPEELENLGTNGRNIKQLAFLVPGAASNLPDFDSPGAQFQSGAIQFNGMRSDDNNWMIDGGEAYDRGGGGIFVVAPSQDAIQEFTVSTSDYAADLGNSSGGMMSVTIKNGTKRFHASAWEYDRNDALDAYQYFAKNGGTPGPKAELRYNAFGFNGGGPVAFKSS